MRLVLVIETGPDRDGAPVHIGSGYAPEATPPARPAEPAPAEPAPAEPQEPADMELRPPNLEEAWTLLVTAQRRLRDNMGEDPDTDAARRMWIGGGLAVLAALTGQDAEQLAADLGRDAPVLLYNGMPVRAPRDIPRPPPPPGAPRPILDETQPLMEPDPGLDRFVTTPNEEGISEPDPG